MKFVSEMSKKILPTASTLIRAVVTVARGFGMVTDSVPSLGVLASSTVGNVAPPSIDSRILTFAASEFNPITAQPMVGDVLPSIVTFVPRGCHAERADRVVHDDLRLRGIDATAAGAIVRAVTWNVIVRLVNGSRSPVTQVNPAQLYTSGGTFVLFST